MYYIAFISYIFFLVLIHFVPPQFMALLHIHSLASNWIRLLQELNSIICGQMCTYVKGEKDEKLVFSYVLVSVF